MSCHCHDHEHREHGHGHHHEASHGHGDVEKGTLIRLGAAALLFIDALILPTSGWTRPASFLVPYLLAGFPVLKEAAENIAHGEVFDENLLMAVASLGAIALGDYPEAVAVMLLYSIGELCEELAVSKSRRSVEALLTLCPETARVERSGETVGVAPEEVEVGDILWIEPGERVPLDGVVIEGTASLDTAALSGESVPRDVSVGGSVRSGCIDLDGVLRVEVTHPYHDSTVQRILRLVEEAEEGKSRSESFIKRFARLYTPLVAGLAVLLAVVPSLFTGAWTLWLRRALTFLVISCPCALVISVPLTFFAGIGGAAKRGILFKGSTYMEALARTETAALDKTGTLTTGAFTVTAAYPQEGTEAELLSLAAVCERQSHHPLAAALCAAAPKSAATAENMREKPGRGVTATIGGNEVASGNLRLMEELGVPVPGEKKRLPGTAVYVAVNGSYRGCVLLEDTPKAGTDTLAASLRAEGVKKLALLTGDRTAAAERLGELLRPDEILSELSPEGKVDAVRKLRGGLSGKGRLLFVGDGVNDAPVLAAADVGMAMGLLGSDAAVESADVVLMQDELSQIGTAIRLSKRTVRIARENIAFALAVKAVVLLLGALGLTGMGAAVFADVGVCLLCITNALRTPLQIR